MTIDPTTDVGRLRLRVSDTSDLPYFPDAVYTSVLADNQGNLPRTAKAIASYILGILSQRGHRRMGLLEVYGSDAAEAYRKFLILTVTNPNFMDCSPIPYSAFGTDPHPILQFATNWNLNYQIGTQSDQLAYDALGGGLTSTPGRIDL